MRLADLPPCVTHIRDPDTGDYLCGPVLPASGCVDLRLWKDDEWREYVDCDECLSHRQPQAAPASEEVADGE